MKNKYIFFLFLIFCLANLVDIISTVLIGRAEANPIFLFFNSNVILITLKILIMFAGFFLIRRNTYPSHFLYFEIITIMLLATIAYGYAGLSNLNYYFNHKDLVTQAIDLPVEDKIAGYTYYVSIIFFIPFLCNMIAFWFYDRSFNNVTFRKPKRWWQL